MSGGPAFDLAPPNAASLAESLRAFGYELSTAIADLVDNSVSAGAHTVWIDFHWNGTNSVITITDDGLGMAEAVLVAAMRPGSQSPLSERQPHDLGRFGLGLKTASFSQCRKVTVRSRTRADLPFATRCWDLDHIAQVNDWQLLKSADAAAEPHFERLSQLDHGTAVVWQNLDRLTAGNAPDNARQQSRFLERADAVRDHLGMVFHRLMHGNEGIRLLLNDRPIPDWDPFLLNVPATQKLTATRLALRQATVQVQPYILPHHSKLDKAAHKHGAGPLGWNAHQGFYIYRNNRLLVPGTWLGFGWAKEEHYKLARIQVDMPNSLDHDWEIDVTKSRATPPPALRDELRRIGERTRSDAKRIYSFRGARLTPIAASERVFLWEAISRHDKVFYRLNRSHPLLDAALTASNNRAMLNALLRLIEESLPLPHISITSNEQPNSLPAPFEHVTNLQVREVMHQAYRALTASGYGQAEARNRLRTIWPFELFPHLFETLDEDPQNA